MANNIHASSYCRDPRQGAQDPSAFNQYRHEVEQCQKMEATKTQATGYNGNAMMDSPNATPKRETLPATTSAELVKECLQRRKAIILMDEL